MSSEPLRFSGEEKLFGGGDAAPDARMLDFWRWAYGDLTDNTNRGVFAEWMVANLLGASCDATRPAWDAFDCITPEGIKVEVKATAYVQSWTQRQSGPAPRPNAARFSGLCARTWTGADQTQLTDDVTFNADVYVFCLQANQDPGTWSALDLDQWEFYVLPRVRVEQNGCKSMGITTLRRLAAQLPAKQLREAVIAANAEQGEN